ncbi:unnamed protein product [Ixodes pacificus]
MNCSQNDCKVFPLAATRHIRCCVTEVEGALKVKADAPKTNTKKSTATQMHRHGRREAGGVHRACAWGSMMSPPERRVR